MDKIKKKGIIKYMSYSGNWNSKEDVANDFAVELGNSVKILIAGYEYADYSGDAYVLYEENGELFEVYGGHCSCNGLEDSWSPDKVSIEDLQFRLDNGNLSNFVPADELQQIIDRYRLGVKKMKSEIKIGKDEIFALITNKYKTAGFEVSDIKADFTQEQRIDDIMFAGFIVEIDIEVPNLGEIT